ncbi:hypothetical protein FKP32DRAFT_1283596 [Trametes sanguinea]|nr:hypothetical protein FKP32DRAFT_1283596 [Trametes sanguinea]
MDIPHSAALTHGHRRRGTDRADGRARQQSSVRWSRVIRSTALQMPGRDLTCPPASTGLVRRQRAVAFVALRGRRARWDWVAGCSEIPGAGTKRIVASAAESSAGCRLLPAMFPLGLVGQYASIFTRRLNVHSSTAAHSFPKDLSNGSCGRLDGK